MNKWIFVDAGVRVRLVVEAADDTARGCYIIMPYKNIIITILFQVGQ